MPTLLQTCCVEVVRAQLVPGRSPSIVCVVLAPGGSNSSMTSAPDARLDAPQEVLEVQIAAPANRDATKITLAMFAHLVAPGHLQTVTLRINAQIVQPATLQ